MLQELVRGQINSTVRSRGDSYFRQGAAQICTGSPSEVQALVRGGDRYAVIVRRRRNRLSAWCTCPYCDDRIDVCKHIWATILAADAEGYLTGKGKATSLDVVADPQLGADAFELNEAFLREEDEDEDEWSDDEDYGQPLAAGARRTPRGRWKNKFEWLRENSVTRAGHNVWPAGREVLYIIDIDACCEENNLVVELANRERKRNGDWSKPKRGGIEQATIPTMPEQADRNILAVLSQLREKTAHFSYYSSFSSMLPTQVVIAAPMFDLVRQMCGTGRCLFRRDGNNDTLSTLTFDEGPAWRFQATAELDKKKQNYIIHGCLERNGEKLSLHDAELTMYEGLVFWTERVARLDVGGAASWLVLLRSEDELKIPVNEAETLRAELAELPELPPLSLPQELQYEEALGTPRPRLVVRNGNSNPWRQKKQKVKGELSFDYEGKVVPVESTARGVYDADARRLLLRDKDQELAAAALLKQLGFSESTYRDERDMDLLANQFPRVAQALLREGWHVEAEGKLYRQTGSFKINVSSGIDWFELDAVADFDGQSASLPQLLAALKRGENLITLGDGSFGMIPEDWLKKYGTLVGVGKTHDDKLRFKKTQVGFLDALLAAQPEASCDAVFEQARAALREFEGVAAAEAPENFTGTLRAYQREGLGWFHFLQRFGFGGCLADDMGLGKTVQVLALLAERRRLRGKGKGETPPSLVVVPRSLVFNWKQEAERFVPELRVLDHTGLARTRSTDAFEDHDLIITTYGTLRRDAELFKDFVFDYCILDEAQAVKNAGTDTAKVVRLLQCSHRLALSGTPIENHLGELWSLFEFLNPGMLGTSNALKLGGAGGRAIEPETRELLARCLRPFLLRRTKEQVAPDLPAKAEQTVFCDLDADQRKHYNQLRDHYRAALLARVDEKGLKNSKIQVLEALLRLRQAACHPGLIDKNRVDEASTKLDLLLPRLGEVTEEGHKALVFSQFTQFLSIIRKRLDAEGITYEYLDGRTRKRQDKVERFQDDPDCKLFLISLKAGGLGLNLTAAEYVFLIDPWWNPAVEAQAVDRAHRIGQERPVFAYRLIARDTVEEKVLELQKSKRELANAIISADNSVLRNLSRDDLQLLLS